MKHPSNIDFGVGSRDLLTQVNGRDIHSMRDLATALAHSPPATTTTFTFSGREEALDPAAAAADTELLQHYNIHPRTDWSCPMTKALTAFFTGWLWAASTSTQGRIAISRLKPRWSRSS